MVLTLVAERRQELVEEVPVCPVNLHHLKASVDRAARGSGETVDDSRDPRLVQRSGGVVSRERNRGRRNRGPTTVAERHRSLSRPLAVRRGLAPRMLQLHSGHCTLTLDEGGDTGPGIALGVIPEAGAPR